MINYVDLFAGPGGLSHGFQLVRDAKGKQVFNLLKAVEYDPFSCMTLRKNLGESGDSLVLEGDLRQKEVREKIRSECAGHTDLVLAGPPCQSFSMIGPRSGNPGKKKDTDRYDGLYRYFVGVVEDLMPSFIVFENVRGILSKKNGNGKVIDIILDDLRSLGYNFESENPGFRNGHIVLNAADYGVPQTRERIFLIGNRLGIKNPFPKPTHYDPEALPLNRFFEPEMLPYVTLLDAIGDLPRLRAKKTMTHVPRSRRADVERYNSRVFSGADEIPYDSSRLKKHMSGLGPVGRGFMAFIRDGSGDILTHHVARPQQESDLKLFAGMKPGSTAKHLITAGDSRSRRLAALIRYDMESFKDKYKKHRWDRPCSTIFAHMRRDGNRFIHPDGRQARTFTPREAARIQSFPDSYTFEGPVLRKFEQIGNAVPPLLARAIAAAIWSKWCEAHDEV
jgi:DNA (cytosine-5)-methyltransferase 1